MESRNDSPSSFASTVSSISWHSTSSSNRTSRRTQNVLLVTLSFVIFLTVIQLARLTQISGYAEPDAAAYLEPSTKISTRRLRFAPLYQKSDTQTSQQSNETVAITPLSKRYAVANFVDSEKYLYGIYSIHNQMKKFNMLPSIEHVVLVSSGMENRYKELLREWIGPESILEVDEKFVRNHVPGGVWSLVFSKIEFFNLTQFDKVIGLDNDILIRKNLAHWFDYPTPAATQARGTIEWNSGAMVIKPSDYLYRKLLEYIPKTQKWNAEADKGIDGFNSGHGHQGFLSSFFLSNVTNDTMHTMSYGASVLSSDLNRVNKNEYFWKYRNDAIETVHLTLHKPWKSKTSASHYVLCTVLKEWVDSVADAPKRDLPPLPDILRKCERKDESESKEKEKPLFDEEELIKAAASKAKDATKQEKALKRHKMARAAIKKRRDARREGLPATPTPAMTGTSDLCFVSSAYSSSLTSLESLLDVTEIKQEFFAGSKFYLFTDIQGLHAPGWTKVNQSVDDRRQTIAAKYLAWKEPFIQDCRVVYYMKENVSPKVDTSRELLELADIIVKSESGFAQNLAPRKPTNTLLAELKYILRSGKDIQSNVQLAEQWFQTQPDFEETKHAGIYDTSVFGYNPKSSEFQAAAHFFWDRYSMEDGRIHEQPLWAYTLGKLGLVPEILGGRRREYFVTRRDSLMETKYIRSQDSMVEASGIAYQ